MLTVSSFTQSLSSTPLFSKTLSTAYERLSSGLRINQAADDSAGLQISNRLTSESLAKNQLRRNLNDGISYAQIAEGGLQESADILQRMRQLAMQSQNGINSDADRRALDKEFQQLKNALNGIAYNTEAFNRLPLLGDNDLLSDNVSSIGDTFVKGTPTRLNSGLRSVAYIPAGSTNISINIDSFSLDDDLQVFTTSGRHLVGTPLSDDVWDTNSVNSPSDIKSLLFLTQEGYTPTASYDGSSLITNGTGTINGTTFTFSGDQHPGVTTETLTIDNTNEPLIISVVGNGVFDATVDWDTLGAPGSGGNSFEAGPVDITATNSLSEGTDYINLAKTPVGLSDLNMIESDVLTFENAEAALQQIDDALAYVSESRAFYGAKMSQMESALKLNDRMHEGLMAARSQILDTDFASETAKSTQAQIVEQASISVRAQAKSSDEQVLGLLGSIGES
ncbi:flagellin [Alteromonas mediterranea]|uniref:flagellin N-terminal helical domain-containing protein n=1 Tax=Alteromonas mediterranea TaxID=314275 RepID=UPI001130C4DB|nr:flagellin [Alteromonas mediterranea]QDG36266.1 flagellin [Alteromonas mediterranea]